MRHTTQRLCFLLLGLLGISAACGAPVTLSALEQQSIHCQYHLSTTAQQMPCFETVIEHIHSAMTHMPDNPELETLLAINYASLASLKGGTTALSLLRQAKTLLEKVIHTDPTVLRNTPYAILGTLYYRAPGWPFSFGDNAHAEQLLKKALILAPESLVANDFYADFLARQGARAQAIQLLKHALTLPVNPQYRLADEGRKQDIQTLLKTLQSSQ